MPSTPASGQTQTKVFCIGLPKSGTTSFAACMRELGYRHRGGPVQEGAVAVSIGRPQILDRVIAKFDSFDDTPWPLMYDYLDRTYPGSRFVLTRRSSPEVWLQSLKKHAPRVGATNALRLVFGHYELEGHEAELIARYERHLAEVRAHFAGSERFLELCWEEGDGWPELCGFLGRPVPDLPVPHSNSAGAKSPADLVRTMCERNRLASAVAYARDSDDPEALFDIIETHITAQLTPSFGRRRLREWLKV